MGKKEKETKKYEVIIKEEEYLKLETLMNNIETLNNGDEIGAWLIGKWDIKNKIAYIEEINIPKQEVSSAEVSIEEESMISTINELGMEKSNQIIGHWHIHPFSKGETNWSSIDNEKIKGFMEEGKQRTHFLFLLSSLDTIKARLIINSKVTNGLTKEEYNFQADIDEIEVKNEGIQKIQEKYLKILEKEIKEKVITKKVATVIGWNKKEIKEDYDSNYYYSISKSKKSVELTMQSEFYEFVTERYFLLDDKDYQPNSTAFINGDVILKWNNLSKRAKREILLAIETEMYSFVKEYDKKESYKIPEYNPNMYQGYWG